jgi:predicted ArsR family transcriptional regulator
MTCRHRSNPFDQDGAPRQHGSAASRPIREETAMSVLDDYLVDPKLSLLDKTRIQAQVLVPVLRALRAELGKEKADAIVRQALRGWSKQLFAAVGDSVDGSPRRKWAAMQAAWAEISEQAVTVEMRRHDKEALEFDVTDCRFAIFFRALGEPELGALLVCETDFDIAAAGGSEVSFTRDQTIMQGAPSCTFRYKFAARS